MTVPAKLARLASQFRSQFQVGDGERSLRQHAQPLRLQLDQQPLEVARRGEQGCLDLGVGQAVAVHVHVGVALDLRLNLHLPLILRGKPRLGHHFQHRFR